MRKKPYTEVGIKRLKCSRCGGQGFATWQACADDNVFRVLCKSCDIELNRLAMEFMKLPDREKKLEKYKERLG